MMRIVRDDAACTTSFVVTDEEMARKDDGHIPITATELARRLLVAAALHGDRPVYDAANMDLSEICPRAGDAPDERRPRPDYFGVY